MLSQSTRACLVASVLAVMPGCGSESSDAPTRQTNPTESPAQSVAPPVAPAISGKTPEPTNQPSANQRSANGSPNVPGFADPSFEPYVAPGTIKWNSDNAKNANIPPQLPIYGNATPIGGSSSSQRFVFDWTSTDSKKDVMEFFRDELPKAGYKIENEASYGIFEAVREGEALSVWIGSPPNKPITITVRLEYK